MQVKLMISLLFMRFLMFICIFIIIKSHITSGSIRWRWRTIWIWIVSIPFRKKIVWNKIMINNNELTYRLSELSRKPFANGLLSIFNWVTYLEYYKGISFYWNYLTYIGILISSDSNKLCFGKCKYMF